MEMVWIIFGISWNNDFFGYKYLVFDIYRNNNEFWFRFFVDVIGGVFFS